MRQNHQVHYHQRMNQRQLLVRFSIVFVTFILVALTLIYTGTLLLPSSQTDDFEYDDYHAVEFFSHLQQGLRTEPRAQETQNDVVRMGENVS